MPFPKSSIIVSAEAPRSTFSFRTLWRSALGLSRLARKGCCWDVHGDAIKLESGAPWAIDTIDVAAGNRQLRYTLAKLL